MMSGTLYILPSAGFEPKPWKLMIREHATFTRATYEFVAYLTDEKATSVNNTGVPYMYPDSVESDLQKYEQHRTLWAIGA